MSMGNWRTWGAQAGGVTLVAGALALALVAQGGGAGPGSSTPDARAKAAPPVSSRYFGMHVPGLQTAMPGALSGAVGSVNLTTNGVYWPQLQTAPGDPANFNWTRLDALVDQARANGAQPMLVLGQTPAFASTAPTAANVSGTVPTMTAWKTYVQAVVAQVRHAARLRDLARAQRCRELVRHARSSSPRSRSRQPRSSTLQPRGLWWCRLRW